MTLDEFFTELENLNYEWEILNIGYDRELIRTKNTCKCPITALAEKKAVDIFALSEYGTAGRLLGLSEMDTYDIVNAADYSKYYLRERLLEATVYATELRSQEGKTINET